MNKLAFYTYYDNYYISSEIEKFYKRNKKVEFSVFRDIIIIPKLSEICDTNDIWWSHTDKIKACTSMSMEIQCLQKIYPNITVKEAMRILYQPGQCDISFIK
jgi:hypothetical protein